MQITDVGITSQRRYGYHKVHLIESRSAGSLDKKNEPGMAGNIGHQPCATILSQFL